MTREAEQTVDQKLAALANRARRGRPFTQEELAKEVGCCRQYISKIETRALSKLKDTAWPIWRELRDG